jgi:hypothetical protein
LPQQLLPNTSILSSSSQKLLTLVYLPSCSLTTQKQQQREKG